MKSWHVVCALSMWLALSVSTYAAEPHAQFLQALQSEGYGEMALAYLDDLEARKVVPAELRIIWDLERSKCLRIAAGEAYDNEQRQARMAEADTLLNKFLKEHPGHPAAAPALIGLADEILQKAQMSLGMSRATREAADQEAHRKAAREEFAAAGKQLAEIQTRLAARLKELGPLPEGAAATPERLDLDFALLECRFKIALVDYMSAQTYTDLKDATRKKLLQQSSKSFDAIFQRNRGTRAGFLAHMWHGKTLEELGDEVTAMEVYDEVLVASPEKGQSQEDAALFGQAALFRLQLIARKGTAEAMIQEGDEWLRTNRVWDKTVPYQGVALEVAKARMAGAMKATGAEQKKRLRETSTMLQAITKVDSEFKQEALLLRREVQEKLGADGGAVSADEEIALGDAAVLAKDWTEATACYERALTAAQKTKDTKRSESALQRLTAVRYQLAVELYIAKKHDEALKAAGAIVTQSPKDPAAVQASGLAVAAALELYAAAKDDAKQAALERLERVANYAIEHLPDRAEADDARMALARAKLLKGDEDAALELLDKVNVRSKRYGTAQQVAGQLHWKRYLVAKKKGDDPQSEALVASRQQARKRLNESLLSLKQLDSKEESHLATLTDTQLLLAEATLEDQAPSDAAPLFAELAASIAKAKPSEIDVHTLRVFVGAVRSELATGNVAKAGETTMTLVDLSGDSAQVNGVLVDFSKLIGVELKKAEAEITRLGALTPSEPAKVQQAIVAAEAVKKVLGQLVAKLAERQELSLPGLIYLGDTSASLNLHQQARDIYQRVLQRIEKPQSGDDATAFAKATTRIRAQLISILRNEGKYDEANKQADALIATHPNALEPLMEKGRILQAWAEKDAKRYDECVAHWTRIRMMLGRLKSRPPEYYEVLYNASFCLLQQGIATKDPAKSLQAQQLIKSTLTLTPNLDGPDRVEKFKALLTKIEAHSKAGDPKAKPGTTKQVGKK